MATMDTDLQADTKTHQEKAIWEVCDNPKAEPNKYQVCLQATGFTHVSLGKEKIAVICLILTKNTPEGATPKDAQATISDPFLQACIKQYKAPFKLNTPSSQHLKEVKDQKSRMLILLGKMSAHVAKRFFEALEREGIDNKSPNFSTIKIKYNPYKESDAYITVHTEMMQAFFENKYDIAIEKAKALHAMVISENAKKSQFALHMKKGAWCLDDSDAALVLGVYLKQRSQEHAIAAYSIVPPNSLFYDEAQQAIADIQKLMFETKVKEKLKQLNSVAEEEHEVVHEIVTTFLVQYRKRDILGKERERDYKNKLNALLKDQAQTDQHFNAIVTAIDSVDQETSKSRVSAGKKT